MRGWMILLAAAILGIAAACNEIIVEKKPETPGSREKEDTAKQYIPVDDYIIKKGDHYSNGHWFSTQTKSAINFRAKFDSTAIYTTKDPINQGDINKLWGMSDCNSLHQINSARFGWRWYNDEMQIWAYCYVNGERMYKEVGVVPLNSFNDYSITFGEGKYIFRLNDTEVEMPRHCDGMADGYSLLPYFGGDESAEHNITIHIIELGS